MERRMMKMFLAEDSEIADSYADLFKPEFDVVIAKSGAEAIALIGPGAAFDICILDVIMPVESPDLSLADAESTGIRLLKTILDNGVASRIIVLTVRWDIEDTIRAIVDDKAQCELILKQRANSTLIRSTVDRLMKDVRSREVSDDNK